jgi:apolipoprotein N-acyltransferase
MAKYERDEDRIEQLDRHWIELLQELRLAQTGTQIFFAFLLTIAFTQPFRDADRFTHLVFAGTLITSAIAMGLFLAPVSFHRLTYQQKVRDKMLPIAGGLTIVGMVFLVIAIAGGLLLALDVVLGRNEAYVVVAVVVAIVLVSWYGLPAWVRRVS